MPTAICNTCNALVTWRAGPRQHIKQQQCTCGSRNLTAVSSRFTADLTGLNYYDRRGNFKKYVPRDTETILK